MDSRGVILDKYTQMVFFLRRQVGSKEMIVFKSIQDSISLGNLMNWFHMIPIYYLTIICWNMKNILCAG